MIRAQKHLSRPTKGVKVTIFLDEAEASEARPSLAVARDLMAPWSEAGADYLYFTENVECR